MTFKNFIPEEMKINYLDRRRNDLTNCRQALSKLDFEYLASVAHQIKGNASSFGYDELSEIAIEIENFAFNKDAENLIKTLNRFELFLSHR